MDESSTRTRPEEVGEREVDFGTGSIASVEENPLMRWILISGNRWLVSAVALSLVVLGLLVLGVVWTDELRSLFTETQVIQPIFLALLSGVILLVSIAVSVNSIVLSQEITSLGEQEDRIDENFSFRDSVQTYTDASVSPARPAEFLRVIIEGIRGDAENLLDSVSDRDSELHERTEALTNDIIGQVQAVEDRLERGSFGTSDVLFAGINYDYSRQVYAARRLRAEHGDELTDVQQQKIDDLLTVLKYFTIGREYFKTLYFKRELAKLSRGLLLISFLAIVFLTYALLAVRAGLLPDISIFGIPTVVLFIGLFYTVGLSPYTLFSAYVLRSATISIETLAAGPFILEDDEGETGRT